MIRTVLAVLLSAALLAAAQPPVEHAAQDRSAAQVRADLDALDAAATDLAETEEIPPSGPGATRSVTVELPRAGVGAAPVRRVVVTPTNRTYRYRVAGRPPETVEGTVPVATASGEPLVLRGAGTHRLVLSLRDRGSLRADADPRVVARRATPRAAGTASLAAGTAGSSAAGTVRSSATESVRSSAAGTVRSSAAGTVRSSAVGVQVPTAGDAPASTGGAASASAVRTVRGDSS